MAAHYPNIKYVDVHFPSAYITLSMMVIEQHLTVIYSNKLIIILISYGLPALIKDAVSHSFIICKSWLPQEFTKAKMNSFDDAGRSTATMQFSLAQNPRSSQSPSRGVKMVRHADLPKQGMQQSSSSNYPSHYQQQQYQPPQQQYQPPQQQYQQAAPNSSTSQHHSSTTSHPNSSTNHQLNILQHSSHSISHNKIFDPTMTNPLVNLAKRHPLRTQVVNMVPNL
ncbi:hypothetical protein EB796_014317 [Bugula neritina]|uniref:Uncharacterized protein n=1 Tax=Bugula neritina TaxID=10212 RepID=A0A7J7JP35_BUGNE|nr:hypothetical protein EB796_014317 [Bugula neritina]